MSELPSLIKKYNNSYHNSNKTTPIRASKKSNEKLVFDNFQNKRQKRKPNFYLGQLVRTAGIKKVFSKSLFQQIGVI